MRACWILVVSSLLLAGLSACSGSDDGSTADRFEVPPIDPELAEQAKTDSTARAQIPLAYVDGEAVKAGLLETQLHILLKEQTRKEFSKNPDVLQIALSAVLDQIALARQAEEEGFTLTPAEEYELYLTRVRMISDHYLKSVVWDKALPSMEEVREFYDNNQAGYLNPVQVMTRHILVDSQSKAMDLKSLVDSGGAQFGSLCRQHSLDENSREIGGNQGWLYRGREILGVGKDDEYIDLAVTLEENETAVYKSPRGWHVIQVTERAGGDLKPFEEVAEGIQESMGQKAWTATYNQVCLDLRNKYAVTMSPEGLAAYANVENTVQRTFAMAQSQDQATAKIELWRKIVFDYPKTKFAPEAQFMIAYTYLDEMHDHWEANRQVGRLQKSYPGTEWAAAGELLKKWIDPNVPRNWSDHAHDEYGGHEFEDLGIPEPHELLRMAKEGGQ